MSQLRRYETRRTLFHSIIFALGCYACSSVLVVFGTLFGFWHSGSLEPPWTAFTRFDGRAYLEIQGEGYHYEPRRPSTVAFFPLYPLLGSVLMRASSLPPYVALLLTAHVFLAGALVMQCVYTRYTLRAHHEIPRTLADKTEHSRLHALLRTPSDVFGSASAVGTIALLLFSVFPTTFFFRMAHSESTFVFLSLTCMFGIARRWPLLPLSLLVGITTAARPVGVALLLPLLIYIYDNSPCWRRALMTAIWVLPVACCGLIFYMGFQLLEFGDPLAFARTQEYYRVRPHCHWLTKVESLLVAQPIWSVYDPSSPGYWQDTSDVSALLSLQFANPLYFVGAAVLTLIGAYNRWLTLGEIALCVALLLIPYVTRSYEMCMLSHGRFVAVAFPLYTVAAHVLARMPIVLTIIPLVGAAWLLFEYSVQFGGGFWMG